MNAYRHTALNDAAKGGHLEVVRLLIDKGAKVKAMSADGHTAIHDAAKGGHLEVVRLLIAKGAKL